jgi:hypothetical protein
MPPAKKAKLIAGQGTLGFGGKPPGVAPGAPPPPAAAAPAAGGPVDRDREVVETYLAERVYWGHLVNKDQWKQLYELCAGAGGSAAKWDKKTKRMGTTDLSVLPKLVHSGLWTPTNIAPRARGLLLELAAEKEQAETARAAERAEAKRIEAAAAAEAAALRDTVFQTPEQQKAAMVRSVTLRDEDPNDPEDLAYMIELGFPGEAEEMETLLEAQRRWSELGPAAGLSPSARVLRYVALAADWDVAVEKGREVPRPRNEAQACAGRRVVAELVARARAAANTPGM